MNGAVFIQARMGSTRLPGKVLEKLGGIEALEHVVRRAEAARIGEVVVLTTFGPEDLPIVRFCAARGNRVFCGSSSDVLDRFWQAARLLDVDHVARVTADCPVLDPEVVRQVAELHLRSGADYTSNTLPESYPDGLDCEIFTKPALERAWLEGRLPSEREHVTPYMKTHPELFRRESLVCPRNLNHMRWTLDTASDAAFLEAVFAELGTGGFGMGDVLRLLEARPDIAAINAGQIRNEGYLKSLAEDSRASAGAPTPPAHEKAKET